MKAALPDWMRDIAPDELPAQHRALADVVGLDCLLKLMAVHGGETLYIPKADALERSIRDERIRQEFNGVNLRELARKYGLSERRIYAIVEGMQVELPGQYSLLDGL